MNLRSKSGIYCIMNLKDSKRYFGESGNIGLRKTSHKTKLNNNRGTPNRILQQAWNRDGEESFNIFMIEEMPNSTREQRVYREKYYTDLYKTRDFEFGYNVMDPVEQFFNNSYTTREKQNKIIVIKPPKEMKEVYQIDINTNEILNSWRSVDQLHKDLGLNKKHLYDALVKRQYKKKGGGTRTILSYRGYVWVYKDEWEEDRDYTPKANKKERNYIWTENRINKLKERMIKFHPCRKSTELLNPKGEIEIFETRKQACIAIECHKATLSKLIKGKINSIKEWKLVKSC